MKQKKFKSVKQYLATLAIAICCATLPGDIPCQGTGTWQTRERRNLIV